MFQIIKKIRYLEHYTLWVFMFLMIFDYHFWEGNWGEAIRFTCIEIFLYVLVFYFNFRVAIPIFLKENKIVQYTLSLIAFLFVYILMIKKGGIEAYLYEGSYWRNMMSMTINFTLFWLISSLYWYYKRMQKERENQLRLTAEKLEAEMKFLKNQISPHFIFNTLNNIYSLVQQGHKNAAPMLAKLSDILRYLLYDSSKEKVLLEKEINTIKKYIELQLLRKPKSENVDFYREGNGSNLRIPPLILLNFVENCFKHSNLDKSEAAWIKISCLVKDGNQLHFTTENSKESSVQRQRENGLGNGNIRRQLELNYPNMHTLTIEDKGEIYTTSFSVKLDK